MKTKIGTSLLIVLWVTLTSFSQSNPNPDTMSLKDKYSLMSWNVEKSLVMDFKNIDIPFNTDFSLMLLRDIFPGKKESIENLIRENPNEFGKKMFADSILSLIDFLKPFPINKPFLHKGKAILGEFDFNENQFPVHVSLNDDFLNYHPSQIFREKTGSITFRYKEKENIPIPISDKAILGAFGSDYWSLFGKNWNVLPMQASKALELQSTAIENDPAKEQRIIYYSMIYAPEIRNDQLSAEVKGISYYSDAEFTDLLYTYGETGTKPTETTNNTISENFSSSPYLRTLIPDNENYRYIIYKGVIESEESLFRNKIFYYSFLLEAFEEREGGQYYMRNIISTRNLTDEYKFPKNAIQICHENGDLIWAEGFTSNSVYGEYGKNGLILGKGSRSDIRDQKNYENHEIYIGFYNTRYDPERILKIYSKRGKEIASTTLKPINANEDNDIISEILKYNINTN